MSIRKAVLTGIALSLLGLLALWLSAKWLGDYDLKTLDGIKAYLIPLAFAAAMVTALKCWPKLNLLGSGQKALRYGFYIPAAALAAFALSWLTTPRNHAPGAGEVLYFLAACLLTGLFEELLCRGLIQNLLEEAFVRNGKSPLAAIVVSSAIFSLMHFANLLDKPYLLLGTVAQVVYTFALGLMLGVVYYKTRSLLAVVLLHGGFNFIGSGIDLFAVSAGPAPAADISLLSVLIQWVIVLPGIYFALRAWKKDAAAEAIS